MKYWKGSISIGAIYLVQSITSLGLVLLITYFSQAFRKKSFWDYGLRKEQMPSFKTIGLLILLALLFQFFCTLLIEMPAKHFFHMKVNFPAISNLSSYICFLLTGIIGGGIREELFFRGYLLNKLTQISPEGRPGLWIASIIQIILFTSGHFYQGAVGILEVVISAVLFTVIYLRTKSLWIVIIFHAVLDIWGLT